MTQNTVQNRKARLFIYSAVVIGVFFIMAIPFYYKHAAKEKDSVTYSRMLMGTIVEITVMDETTESDKAVTAAFAEIKRLEALFSSYMPTSDVSMVSRNAGIGPVKVSPEVIEVVEAALTVAELSSGAFDPTIGSLAPLWGFSAESGRAPKREEVDKLLPLVNYRKVTIDKAAQTIGLKERGMTLNLGGIAKGYIVGKAARSLQENGVRRGIIKAGGDMTIFQNTGSEKPMTIGIQHPRESGKLLGEAFVVNGAVATSGDYERYFMAGDKRYHHIIDPKTGFPATLTQSATIIAKDPVTADGLSTAVFVMGPDAGMALIEKLPDTEAVIVDASGRVRVSSGFKGDISNSAK
ncbi:MAG: FAD:protein FMN transferase [Deltaproteobacteria bacterium]|nr:FAD:protein FMN transferase [Deltaproteobacteria bacterium]